MSLTDMKRKKQSAKESRTQIVEDRDEYAYGLRIDLDNEDTEKLPKVMNLDVKETVRIEAIGKVVSKSVRSSASGESQNSLTIQIEKLEIIDTKDKTKQAETKAFIESRNKEKRAAARYGK